MVSPFFTRTPRTDAALDINCPQSGLLVVCPCGLHDRNGLAVAFATCQFEGCLVIGIWDVRSATGVYGNADDMRLVLCDRSVKNRVPASVHSVRICAEDKNFVKKDLSTIGSSVVRQVLLCFDFRPCSDQEIHHLFKVATVACVYIERSSHPAENRISFGAHAVWVTASGQDLCNRVHIAILCCDMNWIAPTVSTRVVGACNFLRKLVDRQRAKLVDRDGRHSRFGSTTRPQSQSRNSHRSDYHKCHYELSHQLGILRILAGLPAPGRLLLLNLWRTHPKTSPGACGPEARNQWLNRNSRLLITDQKMSSRTMRLTFSGASSNSLVNSVFSFSDG